MNTIPNSILSQELHDDLTPLLKFNKWGGNKNQVTRSYEEDILKVGQAEHQRFRLAWMCCLQADANMPMVTVFSQQHQYPGSKSISSAKT